MALWVKDPVGSLAGELPHPGAWPEGDGCNTILWGLPQESKELKYLQNKVKLLSTAFKSLPNLALV